MKSHEKSTKPIMQLATLLQEQSPDLEPLKLRDRIISSIKIVFPTSHRIFVSKSITSDNPNTIKMKSALALLALLLNTAAATPLAAPLEVIGERNLNS